MALTRRPILASMILGLAAMSSRNAAAQQNPLRLSTGAAGGTFFDYGAAMARLIQQRGQVNVTAVASAGSIENLRRIEAGDADLALVAMGPAFEAWTASAAPWAGGSPLRAGRALVPMYETPFHLATTAATGLRQLRDLDGRQVGVGPRGGANELIFQRLAEGLGIRPNLVFGDPNQLADGVIAGQIDALFFGAGAPVPAYTRIAERTEIRFLAIDGEGRDALRRAFPYLSTGSIVANTYKGQGQAVPTVALWNFIIAREGLDADLAYAIARALLSDAAETAKAHPAAIATRLDNLAANTFMPFHAGALRYFKEAGIPEALTAR